LHKRRWTWKIGFLYCFVCFQSFWTTAVVFETHKECAINKASFFLRTNEKSSQLPMWVTYSTKVSFFSSYSPSTLMHSPHLITILKILYDGNRWLTGDEACALFHCSNKETCNAVQTTKATLGRSQILG
jgi:hypothetical protein